MNETRVVRLIDKEGREGILESTPGFPDGGETEVFIRLDNGQRLLVPADLLVLQDDGVYYLPLTLAKLQDQRQAKQNDETLVVPVLVEELKVEKRQVESGGLRITKTVHEREEMVDELLMKEELQVERVPVNRPVEGPIPIRYVGNTMVVSLLEEVLVVEKRLMLKEELHISKRQVETRQPQPVTLRREEALLEPIDNPEREEVVR